MHRSFHLGRNITRYLLEFMVGVFLCSNLAWSSCTDGNISIIKTQSQSLEKMRLVFFASWCLACKEHLQGLKYDPSIYLIATFDRKEKADAVLKYLQLEHYPCIFDQGDTISAYFKVKELPADIEIGKMGRLDQRQASK